MPRLSLAAAAAVLLAVAGCALAAPVAKIEVKATPDRIIDEGDNVVLTFKLTEPILCPPAVTDCHVTVLLDNTRPDEISLSQCHATWRTGEEQQVRTIVVTVVEDFVDDGEVELVLVTRTATSGASFYNGFDPADIVIKTRSRPPAQCSSVTDPNYITWDGRRYTYNNAGDYVLWRAQHRDFEVQTRVTNGRNCAVAIRDRCDVIVFDQCSGTFGRNAHIKSVKGQGPMVSRSRDGNTYSVTFPSESGAKVKVVRRKRVNARGRRICGWSGCRIAYTYTTTKWLDVFVEAPGSDFGREDGQGPNAPFRTTGLCGSFDNNRGNDPSSGRSFKISNSLIENARRNRFPACVQRAPPTPADTTQCTFKPQPVQRPVLVTVDAEDITDLLKTATLDVEDPRQKYVFVETQTFLPPPPPSLEAENRQFCTTALQQATASAACVQIGVDLSRFVESCVQDLNQQNDTDLAFGTVNAFLEECEFFAITNRSLFTTDATGRLVVSPEQKMIGEQLCQNECNFRGSCVRGKCQCLTGYVGETCEIDVNDIPVTTMLFPAACDRRAAAPCPAAIAVSGDQFLNSPNVSCTVDGAPARATFVDASEITCHLPPFQHRNATPVVRQVAVSTDGLLFSAPLPYVHFDGVCQNCSAGGVCAPKTNSCAINSECFAQGEASPQNPCLTCQPAAAPAAFSFTYADARCGPDFEVNAYFLDVAEDATPQSAPFAAVRAVNPLVAADPANAVAYRLKQPSALFAVDAATGALRVTGALDHEAAPSFQLTVVAEDQAGLTDEVPVTVSVLNINEAPVFAVSAFAAALDENRGRTDLFTVRATDADGSHPTFGGVAYALRGFPSAGLEALFRVSAQGVVSTTGPLDFEAIGNGGVLRFEVVAADGQNEQDVANVTLTVNDVNEAPTFVRLLNAQVAENEPAGTVVGELVTEDPDRGQTFAYTLVDDAAGRYQIVTLPSGAAAVATARANLNFEAKPREHLIRVTSTDSGSPPLALTLDFAVLVLDANDPPSAVGVFELPAGGNRRRRRDAAGATPAPRTPLTSIPEDHGIDLPVADLVVADEDAGQTHTFTLLDDAQGTFAVAGAQLILRKPLDFEVATSVALRIVAADSGVPPASSPEANFTFAVLDRPDVPKDFKFAPGLAVTEATPPGTLLGTVTARDDDPQDMVFSLATQAARFSLGATTCAPLLAGRICSAELTLTAPLDHETAAEELIVVRAASTDGLFGQGTVAVAVADLNEPTTGLTFLPTVTSLVSHVSAGTAFGELVPVDPDTAPAEAYGYSLTQPHPLFRLDGNKLVLTGRFADAAASHAFDVEVSDGALPAQTFGVAFDVAKTAIALDTVGGAGVDEDAAPGATVGTVSLANFEAQEAFALTLAGDAGGLFALSADNRVVVADGAALDFETGAAHVVRVTASFAGPYDPITQELTILVRDVNEPPAFVAAGQAPVKRLVTSSGAGELLGLVAAADPDGDALVYTIVSGGEGGLISVDATGRVTLTGPATGLAPGLRSVVVRVADPAGLSPPQDATVPLLVVNDQVQRANPNTGGSGGSSSGASVGAIVGGVIGALIVLALIVLAVVLVGKRRDQQTGPSSAAARAFIGGATNPMYFQPDADKGPQYEAFTAGGAPFQPGVANPMYAWYQPEVSREDAVRQLAGGRLGGFVVRDYQPTPGWHMIHTKARQSGRPDLDVHDAKIRLDQGAYSIHSPNAHVPTFRSVPELVHHYASADQRELPAALHLDEDIYDNSAIGAGGQGGQGGRAGQHRRDANAPALPLKEREQGAAHAIASMGGEGLYTNRDEAMQALQSSA